MLYGHLNDHVFDWLGLILDFLINDKDVRFAFVEILRFICDKIKL